MSASGIHKSIKLLLCQKHLKYLRHTHSGTGNWTSSRIRSTFYDYFQNHDHQYVHSSSVVAPKHSGTYFTNAGMNQFKPVFLGTLVPGSELAGYRRVYNSQKCIRVGGKHNDLSDVGTDTFHHTFFEMLGSWSFGDYFKKEACTMAWTLLREVYKLPRERLYVTYYGGDREVGLQPDLETRDIWLNLGIAAENIIACRSVDNFWDMGDTGPCGPCTEIHYDRTMSNDGQHLINTGSDLVVELWNLVFMQYDRQSDGTLLTLPAQHVDTGMGLERLTAVLQGKSSNYDTDLFTPIFNTIHQSCSGAPYRGRMGLEDIEGRDTAYRIVADHCRMFTVAIADGLRPSSQNPGSRLRHIMDQCIHQAVDKLNIRSGTLVHLVPIVIDILGDAFPELNHNMGTVEDVVSSAEERYRHTLVKGEEILKKLCPSGTQTLTGEVLAELQDGVWYDTAVPLHIAVSIAIRLGIPHVDIEGFNKIITQLKDRQVERMAETERVTSHALSTSDLTYLRHNNVPLTDSSHKYNQMWDHNTRQVTLTHTGASVVLAMKRGDVFVTSMTEGDHCTVILDQTAFYAEGGGQICDVGTLSNHDCVLRVEDVQDTGGYIVHTGYIQQGSLSTGDTLQPCVDMVRRQKCAVNHSATHLLNTALHQLLEGVLQHGSRVTQTKLVFDFVTSTSQLPERFVETVTSLVNEMIERRMDVHSCEMSVDTARTIPGLIMLRDEVYPRIVRVVTMGADVDEVLSRSDDTLTYSAELCGGCHVGNTGDIEKFVITHVYGLNQAGVKRVVAVTGETACLIMENSLHVDELVTELKQDIRDQTSPDTWVHRKEHIERLLYNEETFTLPRLDRDRFKTHIIEINTAAVKNIKNKTHKLELKQTISSLLESNTSEYFIHAFREPHALKKLGPALAMCAPDKPVLLFADSIKSKARKTKHSKPGNPDAKLAVAVAYMPHSSTTNAPEVSAESWLSYLQTHCPHHIQSIGPVANVTVHDAQLHYITLYIDSTYTLEHFIQLARTYIDTVFTEDTPHS